MELAKICLNQVIQLTILMIAGIILKKTNIISKDGKQVLSKILIDLAVPCMIIDSYLGNSNSSLSNIGLSFIYSGIICLIGIIISCVTSYPVKKENKGIFKFACSFSNAAYMGFPLVRALFNEEGIIYASSYVTVFNILLWTIGYSFFTNKSSFKDILKSILRCPPIISVIIGLLIFFLNIPLPEVITSPLSMIGDMTTPISMIIIGATLGEINLKELVNNKEIYYAIFIRLILIPILSLFILKVFNLPDIIYYVILILHACPCASITVLLAINHKQDEKYASGVVLISVILSIITLPIYTYLLTIL